jgi:hypothetical protein
MKVSRRFFISGPILAIAALALDYPTDEILERWNKATNVANPWMDKYNMGIKDRRAMLDMPPLFNKVFQSKDWPK